jgi:Fe-S oxidoreductase
VDTVAPIKEIADIIKENGGDSFKYCYQCGTCDVVCPWNRVRQFSMRKIVRQGVFGLTEIESEDIWRCTTCGTCPTRCPRGVNQIEAGRALRRIAHEYDVFPESVTPIVTVAGSLAAEGNPFNMERGKRAEWAKSLGVPAFAEGMEILYFPCCYLAYDPRGKKVGAATVQLLKKAGVDFGILGDKEVCCGESIRKAGNEPVFRQLAKENIKTFIDAGVKKIVVSSPHCYHTFKNEYPEFRVNFEVVHISQYLAELLSTGRLQVKAEFAKTVAYHDPCYLGRHNGTFEQPRDVLKAVPGLDLVELANSRMDSLCCGGGGGRVWMETKKGERFSDLRLDQAAEAKAEVVAASCPYCITMLEDSRLNREDPEAFQVKDITEILVDLI